VARKHASIFLVVGLAYAAGAQTAWWWFGGSSVNPVFFPAAGVTVAALLLAPRSAWPFVLAGAGTAELVVDLAHGTDLALACGWVAVNLTEATLGATLLLAARRWSTIDLSGHADLLAFLALPVALSPAIGGLLAAANEELLHDGAELPEFVLRWWIGDGLGVLVVAGAVLAVTRSGVGRIRARWHEALALTLAATVATALVFALHAVYWAYVPFFVMPWIALRLGTAAVAIVGGLIAVIAAQEVSLSPTSLWDAVEVVPTSGVVYVQVAVALLTATSLLLAAEAGERESAVRERARADEEHRYEHDVAVSLQRALLPERLVTHPQVGLAAIYRPSDTRLEVGGDWYETLSLPGGRIGVAVGDVVGHGLAAAAAMGQLRTAVAALAPESSSPVDLLDQLDEFAQGSMVYSTACFAAVDPATGVVEHASAGHPPMLLVEPGGACRFLPEGRSWPIRAGAGPRGAHGTTLLEPGATLVLYSDGLVERRGETIDCGLERLAAAAERAAALGVDELCATLAAELLGDRELQDDVVVLTVRLLGTPATPIARGGQVASGSA
jgi:serine phosphatase RsbU (regulator of sigma subunit)/integral membrane sensor domain MASE1